MPSTCYNPISCPTGVDQLFAEAWPQPTTTTTGEGAAAVTTVQPTQAELDRKSAYDALYALPGSAPPASTSEKCARYCQEIHRAEAERCRVLRDKVQAALERAGCPSNVTARAGPACAPCQGTFTIPTGGVPSSISFSTDTDTNAATAGSCSSGLCSLKLSTE